MAGEGPTLVDLTEARTRVGQGRCVCGTGVYARPHDEAPLKCTHCGRVRREPALKPPALAFRCGCGSCFFLVALAGVECGACGHAIAFGDLFDAVTQKRGEP